MEDNTQFLKDALKKCGAIYDIEKVLSCVQCNNLANEACLQSCGHIFCRACLRDVDKCPKCHKWAASTSNTNNRALNSIIHNIRQLKACIAKDKTVSTSSLYSQAEAVLHIDSVNSGSEGFGETTTASAVLELGSEKTKGNVCKNIDKPPIRHDDDPESPSHQEIVEELQSSMSLPPPAQPSQRSSSDMSERKSEVEGTVPQRPLLIQDSYAPLSMTYSYPYSLLSQPTFPPTMSKSSSNSPNTSAPPSPLVIPSSKPTPIKSQGPVNRSHPLDHDCIPSPSLSQLDSQFYTRLTAAGTLDTTYASPTQIATENMTVRSTGGGDWTNGGVLVPPSQTERRSVPLEGRSVVSDTYAMGPTMSLDYDLGTEIAATPRDCHATLSSPSNEAVLVSRNHVKSVIEDTYAYSVHGGSSDEDTNDGTGVFASFTRGGCVQGTDTKGRIIADTFCDLPSSSGVKDPKDAIPSTIEAEELMLTVDSPLFSYSDWHASQTGESQRTLVEGQARRIVPDTPVPLVHNSELTLADCSCDRANDMHEMVHDEHSRESQQTREYEVKSGTETERDEYSVDEFSQGGEDSCHTASAAKDGAKSVQKLPGKEVCSSTEPSLEVQLQANSSASPVWHQTPRLATTGSNSYGPTGTLLTDSLQVSVSVTPQPDKSHTASATISSLPCPKFSMAIESDVLTQNPTWPAATVNDEMQPYQTIGDFSSILQVTQSAGSSGTGIMTAPQHMLMRQTSTVNRSDGLVALPHTYSVSSSYAAGYSPPEDLPSESVKKRGRNFLLDAGIDTAERRHGAQSPYVGCASSAVKPVPSAVEAGGGAGSSCTTKKWSHTESLLTGGDDKKFRTPTFITPGLAGADAKEARKAGSRTDIYNPMEVVETYVADPPQSHASRSSTVNRSDGLVALPHTYSVSSSYAAGYSPPEDLPSESVKKRGRNFLLDAGIDTAERRHGAQSPYVGCASSAVKPVPSAVEAGGGAGSSCTTKKWSHTESLLTGGDDKKFRTPTFITPNLPGTDLKEARDTYYHNEYVDASSVKSNHKGQSKSTPHREVDDAISVQSSVERPWKVARTLYEVDSDEECDGCSTQCEAALPPVRQVGEEYGDTGGVSWIASRLDSVDDIEHTDFQSPMGGRMESVTRPTERGNGATLASWGLEIQDEIKDMNRKLLEINHQERNSYDDVSPHQDRSVPDSVHLNPFAKTIESTNTYSADDDRSCEHISPVVSIKISSLSNTTLCMLRSCVEEGVLVPSSIDDSVPRARRLLLTEGVTVQSRSHAGMNTGSKDPVLLCRLTMTYLKAVCLGMWIVDASSWLRECWEHHRVAPFDRYEIAGYQGSTCNVISRAPSRARLAPRDKQGRAGLLRHCVFSIVSAPHSNLESHEHVSSQARDKHGAYIQNSTLADELVPIGDLWWIVFFLGGARLGQWACSRCAESVDQHIFQESHSIVHIELINSTDPVWTARLSGDDSANESLSGGIVGEVRCRNCSKVKKVAKSLVGVGVGWLLDTASNFEWKEPALYTIDSTTNIVNN